MVVAHRQEATVVGSLLADEDPVDRRLHVVVDAALGRALEEGERPIMGIEHHLLRFARIGADERHAAMTEPDVRDLHNRRHAGELDDLVAPVELVGLARRIRERHVRFSDLGTPGSLPPARIAPHRIVATCIAKLAQLLPNSDQRQSLAL